MELLDLDLAAKIASETFIPKLAKTRLVKEWQKADAAGNQQFADQIAQTSGQLGLKGRYLKDISGGGSEAGVDLMMGRAPGLEDQMKQTTLKERFDQKKAIQGVNQKLTSTGREPVPSKPMGTVQTHNPMAATGSEDTSGYVARKLYKPDGTLHRGPFTGQMLQEKKDFTDAARSLSPEAKAMVPEMHGFKQHGPIGNERYSSYHEYVPGMSDLKGQEGFDAMRQAKSQVIAPMAQKGMHVGDVAATHRVLHGGENLNVDSTGAVFNQFKQQGGAYNPGNLVQTPKGPKIVDFITRREGDPGAIAKSQAHYGESMELGSRFNQKSDLGALRKEVFRPSSTMSPGHLNAQGAMLAPVKPPVSATAPTAMAPSGAASGAGTAVAAPKAMAAAKPMSAAPPSPAAPATAAAAPKALPKPAGSLAAAPKPASSGFSAFKPLSAAKPAGTMAAKLPGTLAAKPGVMGSLSKGLHL